MERKIKLTGHNIRIDFSADAKFIIIGGYDGSFKVFDTVQNKIFCKTTLKGSRNDIIIRHQAISFDNKYAAFSALGKVFVMNVAQKEIVWEYEYSKAERVMTVPFCFFNQSSRLLIPDGDRLLIYDIEKETTQHITLPDGSGWTDCIAVNPSNTHIAYKSGNGSWDGRLDREGNITSDSDEFKEDMSNRIFVYDIATRQPTTILDVPYPTIRGKQMNLSGNMKFVDDETLIIYRKAFGFSYFPLKKSKSIFKNLFTANKPNTVNWKKKGFEFGHFRLTKIYAKDRFFLFNSITPDPTSIKYKGNIAIEYAHSPDNSEYILYDMQEDKVLFRQKIGERDAAFHPETKQLAYILCEWDENHKRTEYLCIREV